MAARIGKPKRAIPINVVPDEILNEAKVLAGDRTVPALLTPGKMARETAWKALTDEIGAKLGLKAEKRPVSVRKLELGAEIPALGDEVDSLKATVGKLMDERNEIMAGLQEMQRQLREIAAKEAREGRPELQADLEAIDKS